MKKTLRKAFILLAVVTVMMACAFVLPASAADCHGTIESWIADYIAPTCTENGYTDYYCTCGDLADTTKDDEPDAKDQATGHSYLATEYKKSDDGTYYTRVVKCQNDECVRENGDTPAVIGTEKNSPTRYYLVKFENETASPSLSDVSNHGDYFLEGYYVKDVPASWVVDRTGNEEGQDYEEDYITKTYAPITRVDNDPSVDYGDEITEPEFEYFEEADGTINLYVKHGSTAYADGKSAFAGITPIRNNDTEKGGYEFSTWKAGEADISEKVITENTTFFAEFTAPENHTVTYTFKNGDTPIFESVIGVAYGSTVTYDGEEPKKAGTVENSYKFAGWRVEDKNATDSENFIGRTDPITLYHNHVVIYAQYETIPNRYNVELVNYKGDSFTYNGQPIVRKDVEFFEEIVSDEIVKSDEFTKQIERENTETYTFEATGNWKIYAVNGYKVTGRDILVGLDRFTLPSAVTVEVETGEEITIGYEDYAIISVSPAYLSQAVTYPVTVSIMHNYFLEEDLYDNSRPRSDILDDFYVTAYEVTADGEVQRVLATGQANSEGKVTLYIPFGTKWRFEAVTKNNKYFGYTDISPLSYDADTGKPVYEIIHIEGVGIAPSLSEGWSNGVQQSCRCVCHSFLSGLLLRIYNFIYRIFGIEYKCCDDLFAVHGDILIYD